MSKKLRTPSSLQIADLEAVPIWRYVNSRKGDDTAIRPVTQFPVKNLDGKLVATKVQLSNGQHAWALLGNIDTGNARLTEHFITLSVMKDEQWFTLSRYHDFDYSTRGPLDLARFLGEPVDDVFPIAYDISNCVDGDPRILIGEIPKEPRERLSRAEIIAMAVP